MAAQKRAAEAENTAQKAKKSKTEQSNAPPAAPQKSALASEEIDFPRGGGTSFTPLEFKSIRAEAVQEANEELFKVSSQLLPS
jgi:rRNA biogenesis protein RRP5